MNIQEINDHVYYVGVNDRTTALFENLWQIPYGVSYNSYIVVGEKVALIDTVHVGQCQKFLQNITAIIGNRKIDYLIINHMEPDHSGAISIIKQAYPDVEIIGNSKTLSMLKGFYDITEGLREVKDNEVIDLGENKSLLFRLTPMVHWPETMMTFEQSSKTLFSGDAFGCFGALNGGVIDGNIEIDIYIEEMYRYYAAIVAKYGVFVQKAMTKVGDLPIAMICATHGPVWRDNLVQVIDIYNRLSKFESEDGVVIAYGSMYGNTEDIAETIARTLSDSGVKRIKMFNVSNTDISVMLSAIMRYRGVILGCPTYSNNIYPPMEALLNAIKLREIKNKVVGCFGSYSWAPGITKKLSAVLNETSVDMIDETVEIKQTATERDKADISDFCAKFLDQYSI